MLSAGVGRSVGPGVARRCNLANRGVYLAAVVVSLECRWAEGALLYEASCK